MNEFLLLLLLVEIWFLAKLLRKDAIFIPLPMKTVRKMLKMAGIRKTDILYDLGSGDGKIVIAAAKECGARSVGIEKSSLLCWISKRKVKRNKLEGKVKIIHGDFFRENISKASMVTVYLTQKMNDKLEPKLIKELKKGTRIVSADHEFKNMKELGREKSGHFYIHLYKV